MFRFGQKVVAIADDWSHPRGHLLTAMPHRGGVYHVRGFVPYMGDPHADPKATFILLREIVNPLVNGEEPSFAAHAFRPVTEKTTDISAFTEILNRENKNSRVPISDHLSIERSDALRAIIRLYR